MSTDPRSDRGSFSLVAGGPTYHLVDRLRRRLPNRTIRLWWLPLFVWLPLVLGESVRVVLGSSVDPTLLDLSVHVRLLITLPLLVSSEYLVEQTVRSALTSFYKGNFCDNALVDRIIDSAERMRDSWVVELLLLGLAFLGGQLVLWQVVASTGVFSGEAPVESLTFSRVWYVVIALPVVQFVMFRWFWRWLIWAYVLARISRLPLAPLATHPDYAGGLGCLARPVTGFSSFVMATGALLAGAWGTQVLDHRTTLQALIPGLVAFLLLALLLAVGPLLLFTGHLFRNRRRTLAQYGDFARKYTLGFHRKWITASSDLKEPLGSPDIQSLNDLGSAFQVIAKTRVFVFGNRVIFAVWFAGLLPMIPLFASAIPVDVLLTRILTTVVGGIPL